MSQSSSRASPSPSSLSLPAKLAWIVALVGIDRWTKILAIDHVKDHPAQIFFGDLFRMEYAENPGAFLSLGATLSADTRFWIFAVAVGLFLVGASVVLFRENLTGTPSALPNDQRLDRLTAFSLAVIVGGGIGNLIDRSMRPNHGVVDFLNVGLGNFRTGIFNVADMAIMLGVLLLAWRSFRASPSKTEARA